MALTLHQAANLYYVAYFAREHGGLWPQSAELASLMDTNDGEADVDLRELHQLGFSISALGVATFHTKAAAMYKSEAAIIMAASAACREWGRPWVTEEEIANCARRHYREADEWKIGDLLDAVVLMGYVTCFNGTYECAPKTGQHLLYLKFLLRPPRPSPSRRKP